MFHQKSNVMGDFALIHSIVKIRQIKSNMRKILIDQKYKDTRINGRTVANYRRINKKN